MESFKLLELEDRKLILKKKLKLVRGDAQRFVQRLQGEAKTVQNPGTNTPRRLAYVQGGSTAKKDAIFEKIVSMHATDISRAKSDAADVTLQVESGYIDANKNEMTIGSTVTDGRYEQDMYVDMHLLLCNWNRIGDANVLNTEYFFNGYVYPDIPGVDIEPINAINRCRDFIMDRTEVCWVLRFLSHIQSPGFDAKMMTLPIFFQQIAYYKPFKPNRTLDMFTTNYTVNVEEKLHEQLLGTNWAPMTLTVVQRSVEILFLSLYTVFVFISILHCSDTGYPDRQTKLDHLKVRITSFITRTNSLRLSNFLVEVKNYLREFYAIDTLPEEIPKILSQMQSQDTKIHIRRHTSVMLKSSGGIYVHFYDDMNMSQNMQGILRFFLGGDSYVVKPDKSGESPDDDNESFHSADDGESLHSPDGSSSEGDNVSTATPTSDTDTFKEKLLRTLLEAHGFQQLLNTSLLSQMLYIPQMQALIVARDDSLDNQALKGHRCIHQRLQHSVQSLLGKTGTLECKIIRYVKERQYHSLLNCIIDSRPTPCSDASYTPIIPNDKDSRNLWIKTIHLFCEACMRFDRVIDEGSQTFNDALLMTRKFKTDSIDRAEWVSFHKIFGFEGVPQQTDYNVHWVLEVIFAVNTDKDKTRRFTKSLENGLAKHYVWSIGLGKTRRYHYEKHVFYIIMRMLHIQHDALNPYTGEFKYAEQDPMDV